MRVRLVRLLAAAGLVTLLAGCASGYSQFYRPAPGASPETIARLRAAPAPQSPAVARATQQDMQRALDAFARKGFVSIGSAFFNSGTAQSESAAVQQAKDVGADLVLIINPRYTGSVTSNVPITTPTVSTTYSSGTTNFYGAGGSVTAFGTGVSTTYGSRTTYVPVTEHRSDYGAIFLVVQRVSLGVAFRDLNDDERRALQSNRGVVIERIIDNSPAFHADVLVGDFVAAVDDQPAANQQQLRDLLAERRGKRITLTLVRNGARIDKVIQLGS